MKTFSARPADIEHGWWVIDAEGLVLGRLAAVVAGRLRGKHKPLYTPHIDCGDNVIIVNADKVKLTGNKFKEKTYYRHTGYPGGIKSITAAKVIGGQHPERLIEMAVKRMVPRGPLGRKILTKLRVYAGSEHPHEAQNPESLEVGSMNAKNKRTS